MLAAYEAARIVHIVGGGIGLVSMFVPLSTRKGSPAHRRFGKVFAISMIVAGLSGLAISIAQLAVPWAFGGDLEQIRGRGLFLGTIGLLMLAAVQQMLRALDRKRQAAPKPTALDLGLPIVLLLAGVVTALVGARNGAFLLVGFGALGVFTATLHLRFVRRPLRTPKAWWYQHMLGSMIAIISAVTAFAVFGGRRWLGQLVPEPYAWTMWVGPSVVIVPVFLVWIGRWRRRFGESRRAVVREPAEF